MIILFSLATAGLTGVRVVTVSGHNRLSNALLQLSDLGATRTEESGSAIRKMTAKAGP